MTTNNPVAQAAGLAEAEELPLSMRTNINSIARHIAAPAEDQGADVSEVIQRATDALTLLAQPRTTPADIAERARRVADKYFGEIEAMIGPVEWLDVPRQQLTAIIAAEFTVGENSR